MARARKTRLTDVGVARLKPAASEFTVWDMRVPGLGVRVRRRGIAVTSINARWTVARSASRWGRRR